jgi:alpha-L-fucosidase 2
MSARLWVMALSPLVVSGSVVEYRDVEYARVGDVRLALDAEVPKTDGLVPAAIVVHGGGWVRGDRRVDVEPILAPLSEAGFAWFSISYRLMNSAAQFGAAIDDVAAAIRWVKAHAAEYHVDPERIALIGESAGGQLAAMAMLRDDPALKVQAFVALYAPTDLEALAEKSPMVPQWIRENVKGTPWESMILASLKTLSPIEHVRKGMPPMLLIHGTADTLVPFEQSRAMCERVKAVGGSCELYAVDGAGHGIRWWESTPHEKGYKREMVRWLRERLI